MTDKPKEDKGKIKVDSSQDLHFQCDSDLEAPTQNCGSHIFWRSEVHLDHFGGICTLEVLKEKMCRQVLSLALLLPGFTRVLGAPVIKLCA